MEYDGCRAPHGYGRIGIGGPGQYETEYAHRVAWMLAHGPIPEGLCVLHRCDNPPCANVEHLFLGTRADNVVDMDTKGRSRFFAHKLTPAEREVIVKLYGTGKHTQDALAAMFGVSQATVSALILRRRREST